MDDNLKWDLSMMDKGGMHIKDRTEPPGPSNTPSPSSGKKLQSASLWESFLYERGLKAYPPQNIEDTGAKDAFVDDEHLAPSTFDDDFVDDGTFTGAFVHKLYWMWSSIYSAWSPAVSFLSLPPLLWNIY
jgi:hypothetical protein